MNAKLASKLLPIGIILGFGHFRVAAAAFGALPIAASPVAGPDHFQALAFSDSAEADLLRRAYIILATGDHDYKGHRVRAMKQVESAADLLGLDIKGDLRDRRPQPLSDVKLREAQGLLQKVLGSAEVKDQKRVAKHIAEAINQINVALSIR